jgi:hypothetical protein
MSAMRKREKAIKFQFAQNCNKKQKLCGEFVREKEVDDSKANVFVVKCTMTCNHHIELALNQCSINNKKK